jgi:hypothetical protein
MLNNPIAIAGKRMATKIGGLCCESGAAIRGAIMKKDAAKTVSKSQRKK